jgi:protein-S-isoprenylcysteine O-methyltransferase Ste14
MFKRVLVFGYGIACYAVFFATFLYALCFIGNFQIAGLVPATLDGPTRMPFAQALAIDLGLLALFAVQHSLMARPFFKAWFTRFIPVAAERSTYVLFSSLALILLFAFWQPLGGVIWQVDDPLGRGLLLASFAFGWLLVLVATFLINHFDLFGLRQVWLQLLGKPYTPLRFGTPGPYKLVRHPLYVGWFFAFWSTRTMTGTHLLFAVMTTAYIQVAIRFEERDLVDSLGDDYRRYRERVPMIVPALRRGKRAGSQLKIGA